MSQDPSFEVRLRFLTKLISLLRLRKLDPRFNTILFLTIHDPEAELREMVRVPKELRVNNSFIDFYPVSSVCNVHLQALALW